MDYTVIELLDVAPTGPGQLTRKCRIEQYVHTMGYTAVLSHLSGAISHGGMSGEEAKRILKEYQDSAPPLEYTPLPKLSPFARLVRKVTLRC